jgi:hypothetical protein
VSEQTQPQAPRCRKAGAWKRVSVPNPRYLVGDGLAIAQLHIDSNPCNVAIFPYFTNDASQTCLPDIHACHNTHASL